MNVSPVACRTGIHRVAVIPNNLLDLDQKRTNSHTRSLKMGVVQTINTGISTSSLAVAYLTSILECKQ